MSERLPDELVAQLVDAGLGRRVPELQVDSDDTAEMMWGEVGVLCFYLREGDLRERRWDRAWMIFQCH